MGRIRSQIMIEDQLRLGLPPTMGNVATSILPCWQ